MLDKPHSSILILEDNSIQAAALGEMLEDIGYRVAGIAGTLSRAKQIFGAREVNLILADIDLRDTSPGMDGITVVEQLLQIRKVPIIFLTGKNGEVYRERTRFMRPAAYLLKPVRQQQLDVSVEFALYGGPGEGHGEVILRPADDERFYVRQDGRNLGIWISDICYLKADSGNCYIYTKQGRHHVGTNMGNVLKQIGHPDLRKVHRSYAVHRRSVHSYDTGELYVVRDYSLDRVPFSDGFKDVVKELLPRLRLD